MRQFNRLAPRPAGYGRGVAETQAAFEDLLETLKRAAALLHEAGVPFVLGGGVAIWARGGPESEHELDPFGKPPDREPALDGLAAGGFPAQQPPEQWRYQAADGRR